MNCFCTSINNASDNCCHGNELCSFDGNLDNISSVPIYVQSVYDAVRFNMQGMKTIQNLKFKPAIPCGCTISKICDLRIKKVFNPENYKSSDNLTLEMETGISGASFVNDERGIVNTIGPDGIPSEKMIYPETSTCDSSGNGSPIFGTQNAKLWGNIIIYMDIIVCDSCGHESNMTLCGEVNIAKQNCPLVMTNFFELCVPDITDSAFLPRLTELSNIGFSARAATNNLSRDISIDCNGELSANLIITICITAEKKITVPVQLCVLTTGYVNAPVQENLAGVMNCPGLYPERIEEKNEDIICQCSDYPPNGCK